MIPARGREVEAGVSEFKASLGYKVSTRIVRSVQTDLFWKKRKKTRGVEVKGEIPVTRDPYLDPKMMELEGSLGRPYCLPRL